MWEMIDREDLLLSSLPKRIGDKDTEGHNSRVQLQILKQTNKNAPLLMGYRESKHNFEAIRIGFRSEVYTSIVLV